MWPDRVYCMYILLCRKWTAFVSYSCCRIVINLWCGHWSLGMGVGIQLCVIYIIIKLCMNQNKTVIYLIYIQIVQSHIIVPIHKMYIVR